MERIQPRARVSLVPENLKEPSQRRVLPAAPHGPSGAYEEGREERIQGLETNDIKEFPPKRAGFSDSGGNVFTDAGQPPKRAATEEPAL